MRPRHSLSAVNEGGVNYHDDIYGPEVHEVGTHVARYKTNGMSACHCFGSSAEKSALHALPTRLRERSQSRRGSFLLRSRVPPLLRKLSFPLL